MINSNFHGEHLTFEQNHGIAVIISPNNLTISLGTIIVTDFHTEMLNGIDILRTMNWLCGPTTPNKNEAHINFTTRF